MGGWSYGHQGREFLSPDRPLGLLQLLIAALDGLSGLGDGVAGVGWGWWEETQTEKCKRHYLSGRPRPVNHEDGLEGLHAPCGIEGGGPLNGPGLRAWSCPVAGTTTQTWPPVLQAEAQWWGWGQGQLC